MDSSPNKKKTSIVVSCLNCLFYQVMETSRSNIEIIIKFLFFSCSSSDCLSYMCLSVSISLSISLASYWWGISKEIVAGWEGQNASMNIRDASLSAAFELVTPRWMIYTALSHQVKCQTNNNFLPFPAPKIKSSPINVNKSSSRCLYWNLYCRKNIISA